MFSLQSFLNGFNKLEDQKIMKKIESTFAMEYNYLIITEVSDNKSTDMCLVVKNAEIKENRSQI